MKQNWQNFDSSKIWVMHTWGFIRLSTCFYECNFHNKHLIIAHKLKIELQPES